jgi:predicted NAD/FAD-binding protein
MTSPLDQKLRIEGLVVITANRLRDGVVIYRTAAGGWSPQLADAIVVASADEAKALLAQAAGEGTVAVGPYPAPVELSADRHIVPGNLRERIRATGPTFDLPRVPAEL